MPREPPNKFWEHYVFDDKRWDDVVFEAKLDPFDAEDITAYAEAGWLAIHDDEIKEDVERLNMFEFIIAEAIVMAKVCVQDAAVQWVTDKFDADVAFELEKALRINCTAQQLYKKYDAEFEAEVNRLQKEKDASQ